MKKIAIIGGGFYGCNLALEIEKIIGDCEVEIFEKNDKILQGAISNNQHRLHLGFHYPRCDFTIKQAIRTYDMFVEKYSDCLYKPKENFYLIHKDSNVNFDSYIKKFSNHDLNFKIIDRNDFKYFIKNYNNIEGAISCNELVINLNLLKNKIFRSLSSSKIKVHVNQQVYEIEDNLVYFKTFQKKFDYVINTTYSNPSLGFQDQIRTKNELCFIPILKDNDNIFEKKCFTIMDGKFASIYQTGINKVVSLSNVEFTPFFKDNKIENLIKIKNNLKNEDINEICLKIIQNSKQWFNNLEKMEIINCYISLKTKILQDENDYRGSYILNSDNSSTIMCGKISAYYDIREQLIKNIKERVK